MSPTPAPAAARRRLAVQVLLAAALAGAGRADALRPAPAFAPHARLAHVGQRRAARSTQGVARRVQVAGGELLGLRASMNDYRSRLARKESRLEKLSRQVFNLQDALLQMEIAQEPQQAKPATGPPEPNPQQTVVVGTGPAGLATAIMLARCLPISRARGCKQRTLTRCARLQARMGQHRALRPPAGPAAFRFGRVGRPGGTACAAACVRSP